MLNTRAGRRAAQNGVSPERGAPGLQREETGRSPVDRSEAEGETAADVNARVRGADVEDRVSGTVHIEDASDHLELLRGEPRRNDDAEAVGVSGEGVVDGAGEGGSLGLGERAADAESSAEYGARSGAAGLTAY